MRRCVLSLSLLLFSYWPLLANTRNYNDTDGSKDETDSLLVCRRRIVSLTVFCRFRPGPRLDMDPDIVAALDEDFDYDDPDNILDDDFIIKANSASGATQ